MTKEDKGKLLGDAAAKLAEHFDCIQILASSCEDGGTSSFNFGSGNWYARQGLAHEFINSDISRDAAQMIADKLRPDE